MKPKSLKEKQSATGKFWAEQKPLFSKGVTGSLIFSDKPKNKGGRPPSGRGKLEIWIADSARETMRMLQRERGITPGVFVEMLMSLAEPAGGWSTWQTGKALAQIKQPKRK